MTTPNHQSTNTDSTQWILPVNLRILMELAFSFVSEEENKHKDAQPLGTDLIENGVTASSSADRVSTATPTSYNGSGKTPEGIDSGSNLSANHYAHASSILERHRQSIGDIVVAYDRQYQRQQVGKAPEGQYGVKGAFGLHSSHLKYMRDSTEPRSDRRRERAGLYDHISHNAGSYIFEPNLPAGALPSTGRAFLFQANEASLECITALVVELEAFRSLNKTLQDRVEQLEQQVADLTTAQVARRVINTPELWENVLKYLECKELCHARRVCRQFSVVIDKSPILQRNLFLKPQWREVFWLTPYRWIPIILTGDKAKTHIRAAQAEGKRISGVQIHELHPILTVHRRLWSGTYGLAFNIGEGGSWASAMAFVDKFRVDQVPDDSAIRKMYICQPPVTQVFAFFANYEIKALSADMIRHDEGITFEEIFEVLSHRRSLKESFLCMFFMSGTAVTTEEKRTLESIGEVTWENDPYRVVDFTPDDNGYELVKDKFRMEFEGQH